ncbi:MAG: hypothetical protein AABW49_01335 [Nanoarchaeota archaeon]
MAVILIGGPQVIDGILDPVHDDLVKKLAIGGDTVAYHRQGFGMVLDLLAGTNLRVIWHERQITGMLDLPADIVLCDTRLFFSDYTLDNRIKEFPNVVRKLKKPGAPVIILVEEGLSERYKSYVNRAGFIQVDQPYDVDGLVERVKKTYHAKIN